jgi:effector-binding domain-containing protein
MKKKIILLSLLVLVIAACFIPVTQQETFSIKSPFLNIYRELIIPANWERWRPDIRKDFNADSAKISIKKENSSFSIKYGRQELSVGLNENMLAVNDAWNGSSSKYTYTVIPEKDLKKSSVIVVKTTSAANYLVSKINGSYLSDTHINDLKKFMETDSLLYGCNIIRIKVPDSNLIVIDKEVLAKNKYIEAAKMLTSLQQYLKTHDVKQVRPLIGQFLAKGKDSSLLKVGFFINKEVKSEKEITFMRMPLGGTFYIGTFKGKFKERAKIYAGMHEYFTNHLYQLALIPFETFLDNKLPASDTDKVNVQVIFPSYF